MSGSLLVRNLLRNLLVAALIGSTVTPALTGAALPVPMAQAVDAIQSAVADPRRPPADRARDVYRHPVETLSFFKVSPGQVVVEFDPSGGWYMRVLAPLERGTGHYIAAVPPTAKAIQQGSDLFRQNQPSFGNPTLVAWEPHPGTELAPLFGQPSSDGDEIKVSGDFAPAGTVDRVLTFRNIHNLLMAGPDNGDAGVFFAAAFRALKPGGVLGVEEHRLPEDMDSARETTSGYVKRSTIIRLATAAGFRLDGESAINANPKDTHDWPKGVWTLPPTYSLGDQDRAKYAAIGESDRLTLRFVKP